METETHNEQDGARPVPDAEPAAAAQPAAPSQLHEDLRQLLGGFEQLRAMSQSALGRREQELARLQQRLVDAEAERQELDHLCQGLDNLTGYLAGWLPHLEAGIAGLGAGAGGAEDGAGRTGDAADWRRACEEAELRAETLAQELEMTVYERNSIFEELQQRSQALEALQARIGAVAPPAVAPPGVAQPVVAQQAVAQTPKAAPAPLDDFDIPEAPLSRPASAPPAPGPAAAAAPTGAAPPKTAPPKTAPPQAAPPAAKRRELPRHARVEALPALHEGRDFTPEEVRIASVLSHQSYTVEEIARVLGDSLDQARARIESLMDKGWVDVRV